MDLKTLRTELQKLAALAEGWDASHEIADIERDLALEKLRALYDAVRFGPTPAEAPSPADDALQEDLPLVEIDLDAVMPPAGEPGDVLSPEGMAVAEVSAETSAPVAAGPAVSAAQGPAEEVPVESEATASPVSAAPAASAPAEAAVPEAVARGPVADATSLRLFEMAPLDSKRAKHRVVLSLYGEAEPVGPVCPAAEPVAEERVAPLSSAGVSLSAPEDAAFAPEGSAASAPAAAAPGADVPVTDAPPTEDAPAPLFVPAAEPIAAEPAVLGETLNADVTTVSDLMAATVPPTAVGQEPVTDLHRALCNNDRFLLARDLFGGDMEACERTIDRLNAFDDLDECMIYIAENFDWNPHSDGAKLLVDLIERKLV